MSYGTTDAGNATPNEATSSSPRAVNSDGDAGSVDSAVLRSQRLRQSLSAFYDRNLGLCLVFLAQCCGSIMNVAAKLLSTGYEERFHALQIIFIRMTCTTILGVLYMIIKKTPDFPLGRKDIRGLLVLRGMTGFLGLFGLYYSLTWLELSDATVITFIVPTMTALSCFIFLREPFTWKEGLAGFIAFCGVLCVARPSWLFPATPIDPITGEPKAEAASIMHVLTIASSEHIGRNPPSPPLTPAQRTFTIAIAVFGAFAAGTAYAIIRVVGKRAHSLISVNYFAAIASLGSMIIILVHPDLHFVMPRGWDQWGLIAIIGFAGFLLQFLLTEGLQREKGGRATNLTYLQLVFALVIERVIWGTTPPVESFFGAALIIGAAVWVSLQKTVQTSERKEAADEESSLLRNESAPDREHTQAT